MKALWNSFASRRTTACLLALLALFLLLNVLVPQAAVLGDKGIAELASGSHLKSFFLLTLGLGHLPTSPLFLGCLALFFLHLLSVLADRVGPTLRQLQVRVPTELSLVQRNASEEARVTTLPSGWDMSSALRFLRGHGYSAIPVGKEGVWGVKNRTAPLGFLLFHLSFLLLCLGGVQLFYTREVGMARLVEGQGFEGEYGQVVRKAPWGTPRLPRFSLNDVALTFEEGEPTDLRGTLNIAYPGGVREDTAWVNHPVVEGTTTLLVEEAGVAPELWLQDAEGFTLDRVSVAAKTRGEEGTDFPLWGGKYRVFIQPIWREEGFPSRERLLSHPLALKVSEGETVLFEGNLRPGESAPCGNTLLQLVRYRYWAGLRLVTERGGGALILGFTLAVIGLMWRMLAYRREVGLTWAGGTMRLTGRAEFYPRRFRNEVESLMASVGGLPQDGTPSEAREENL